MKGVISMWQLIKPLLSDIRVWVIFILAIIAASQFFMITVKNAELAVVQSRLDVANNKIAIQDSQFQKLKIIANALDAKLKDADKENAKLAEEHAKKVDEILKSKLPATASCEDVVKWARDIARRKK